MDYSDFRILGLAASLRRASFHRGIVRAAHEVAPEWMSCESFDLARMPFVDSTGLRILIDARRHLDARGRRLVLRAMQPDVERLLRLTAMEAWFQPGGDG